MEYWYISCHNGNKSMRNCIKPLDKRQTRFSQSPATSNQQPATSNQQPALSADRFSLRNNTNNSFIPRRGFLSARFFICSRYLLTFLHLSYPAEQEKIASYTEKLTLRQAKNAYWSDGINIFTRFIQVVLPQQVC